MSDRELEARAEKLAYEYLDCQGYEDPNHPRHYAAKWAYVESYKAAALEERKLGEERIERALKVLEDRPSEKGFTDFCIQQDLKRAIFAAIRILKGKDDKRK